MHAATTRYLKISMCEKSVYISCLHSPGAMKHPGLTSPPSLALHFSSDLHLIPSTRTTWGPTPRTTSALWLGADGLTSALDPLLSWSLSGFKEFCLKATTFLSLV